MKRYINLGIFLVLTLTTSCSNGPSPKGSAQNKTQNRFEINPAELVGAQARNPTNPGVPPGVDVVDAPNDKTDADATATYLVIAKLSSDDGSGTVTVKQKQADGSYAPTNISCQARGSNINQFSQGRVQTPKGLHKVLSTAKYAVFQHAYEETSAWAWGTYFDAVNNNPIGIHGGPLGDISHACIRVPPACAGQIRSLVRTQNSDPPPAAPSWMPSDSSGGAEGVDQSLNIMEVYVQWI